MQGCGVYRRGNLPRRSIVQFDDVAFGMLHDFHATVSCETNKQKTVMLAKRSDPCTALKCCSTRNAAAHAAREHGEPDARSRDHA
jgi:hypothetical protein